MTVITGVSWNNATQTVVITGSGFGTQSPYNGDSSFLSLLDLQEGPTGTGWDAGFGGSEDDLVTLNVTSWTDTQIVIEGFTGSYGSNNWVFQPGDQVVVGVSNANGTPAETNAALAAHFTITVPQPITSTTTGVVLNNPSTQTATTVVAGASVTNTTTQASGDAIYGTPAAAWNITNLGTITATASGAGGVVLAGGGTVTNGTGALIAGVLTGVSINGGVATVVDTGIIAATGTAGVGIQLGASAVDGQIIVSGTGLVTGAVGIAAAPGATTGSTVTVSGTVSSSLGTAGTAVSMGGLGRLIVDLGATFTGSLNGGGGSSVLEITASLLEESAVEGPEPQILAINPGSVTNFGTL